MQNADLRARLASLVQVAIDTRDDDAEGIADVLMAAGVFVPPADAELSEGRYVAVDPTVPTPWGPGELIFSDERVEYRDGPLTRDVTEDYRAWLDLQPGIITRTYEWPEPPPTCPECAAGKHLVCAGIALNYADEIVACRCAHTEVP